MCIFAMLHFYFGNPTNPLFEVCFQGRVSMECKNENAATGVQQILSCQTGPRFQYRFIPMKNNSIRHLKCNGSTVDVMSLDTQLEETHVATQRPWSPLSPLYSTQFDFIVRDFVLSQNYLYGVNQNPISSKCKMIYCNGGLYC